MKTIKEWIDTLPKDIREKAYKYEAGSMIGWNEETPTLQRAIELAFSWGFTEEKFGYWQDVCEQALAGAFDQPEWTHERLVQLLQHASGNSHAWSSEDGLSRDHAEAALKDFLACLAEFNFVPRTEDELNAMRGTQTKGHLLP